jgi:hypothetical protein
MASPPLVVFLRFWHQKLVFIDCPRSDCDDRIEIMAITLARRRTVRPEISDSWSNGVLAWQSDHHYLDSVVAVRTATVNEDDLLMRNSEEHNPRWACLRQFFASGSNVRIKD